MPISSLVVTTRQGHAARVAATLRGLDGVTVTDIRGEELVVVTETPDRGADKRVWDRVEATDHVLGVSLVYHNFEDLHGVLQ